MFHRVLPLYEGGPYHIETSPLIFSANLCDRDLCHGKLHILLRSKSNFFSSIFSHNENPSNHLHVQHFKSTVTTVEHEVKSVQSPFFEFNRLV